MQNQLNEFLQERFFCSILVVLFSLSTPDIHYLPVRAALVILIMSFEGRNGLYYFRLPL